MKVALVLLFEQLTTLGYVHGVDYGFMGNIHDEWQIASKPEIAEQIRKAGCDCIRMAGERLKLNCPLAGEGKIGANWRDTH